MGPWCAIQEAHWEGHGMRGKSKREAPSAGGNMKRCAGRDGETHTVGHKTMQWKEAPDARGHMEGQMKESIH
eukprot:scaffold92013_cov15-Tisochrysis_lutea.AAC.2